VRQDPRVYDIIAAYQRDLDVANTWGDATRVHAGPIVRLDHAGLQGYRLSIFSPSDTPVTASAGVFLFPERQ